MRNSSSQLKIEKRVFHELSSILYLVVSAGNMYMALIYVSGVTIASINFFSKYSVWKMYYNYVVFAVLLSLPSLLHWS